MTTAYPEISVTGFRRRAVLASLGRLDRLERMIPGDHEQWLKDRAEENAAIKADPEHTRGAEIEAAVDAALHRAIDRGVKDVDMLADAVVTDSNVVAVINKPGSAAVILRQFVGMMLKPNDDEDD